MVRSKNQKAFSDTTMALIREIVILSLTFFQSVLSIGKINYMDELNARKVFKFTQFCNTTYKLRLFPAYPIEVGMLETHRYNAAG